MHPRKFTWGVKSWKLGLGENVCRGWGDRRGEVKEEGEDVKALRRKGTQGSFGAPTFQPPTMQFYFFGQNQKPSQTS